MTKIYKKVQQEYFEAVVDGRKRFEVRLADFECQPGDVLVLQEQKTGTKELTGREIDCEVLFNLNTKITEKFYTKEELDKYGLVVLAIRKKYDLERNDSEK
jgi:ASC-1-like (ASCH) protein